MRFQARLLWADRSSNIRPSPGESHPALATRDDNPSTSRLTAFANDPSLFYQSTLKLVPSQVCQPNANNEHFGLSADSKNPDTTRFYFTNINGLQVDKNGGTWRPALLELANIQADFCGLSEINLNHTVTTTTELWNQCRKHFSHAQLQYSGSPGHSDTSYLAGGTLALSMGSLTGRFQSKDSDRMGRWCVQSFTGKNQRLLHVITCYQPCKTQLKGVNTAYAQQARALDLEAVQSGISSNPRKRFIADLQALIQRYHDDGDEVIVAGDFNETIDGHNSQMGKLASAIGLRDLFAERYGTSQEPSTYIRGHRRIDYILVSPSLLPCVDECGYEAFHYRFSTDHRGMYVDFHTKKLFGDDLARLPPLPLRTFTAKDPEAVRQYIKARAQYLRDHQAHARIDALEQSTQPCPHLLEALDADLLRSAKHGEKAARKNHTQPWSPTLRRLRRRAQFLKTLITGFKTGTDMTTPLQRLPPWESLAAPDTPRPSSTSQARALLKQTYRDIRDAIANASDLRQQFLRERAEELAQEGDKEAEQLLRQMQRAEHLSNIFRKFRGLRSYGTKQGLTRLQVPVDSTSDPKAIAHDESCWRTLDTPQEIEAALRTRNRRHFGQATGTPFTSAQMKAKLDFTGSSSVSDLILQGQFSSDELDEISNVFVSHLRRQHDGAELPAPITENDFIDKLRNWPEKTSTSPSGMHLSHYHCLFRSPGLDPDSTEYQEFLRDRALIIRCHLAVINLACKWAYSMSRWRQIVNVMILKDPGNFKIHRLRVIHLYEADYNLLLSVKWRDALYHAEDQHLLNDGMYGSRPGRTAHEPVYLEEMQSEVYRTSFKPGLKLDLDATSCYDRILPAIANIASRRVGINRNVALVNARTLEEAEYFLKTTLGLSSGSYKHCATYPLYGTGQGSGNSPHIWCFICSTLFDAYSSKAHGMTFSSPDGDHTITIYMVGFVDDCSLGVNDFGPVPPANPQPLLNRLQHDCQIWNDLLWSSGGDLELPKCSFHYYRTSLSTTSVAYNSTLPSGSTLEIRTGDRSSTIPVRQLPPTTSHKTLGYYKNPAGEPKQQIAVLMDKARAFRRLAASVPLTREETWIFYSAIYNPSLSYPLPCSHLTRKQLQRVESIATGTLLNRLGYSRNFPRKVTFAPRHRGGVGLCSLYCLQGLGGLEMLLKHLRTPGQCQKLTHIALSWVQFQSGMSTSILADVSTPLPHSTSKWFMAVRSFLHDIGGTIEMEQDFTLPPERYDDKHIMDLVCAGAWTAAQTRMINHVRLFINVVTISDMTFSCGTRLDTALCAGRPSLFSSQSRHLPASVNPPSPLAWRWWRKFLRSIATSRGVLFRPLGHWMISPTDSRRVWPALFDHSIGRLWLLDRTTLLYHANIIASRHRIHGEDPFYDPTKYPSGTPVRLSYSTSGVRFRPTGAKIARPARLPKPHGTFDEYLRLLPSWEAQLLSNLTMSADPFFIAGCLRVPTFMGSDGSVVKARHGASAWILSTILGRRLCHNSCHTPGDRPSSFRAEGYGILSALRFLYHVVRYTQTSGPFGSIVLYTDSKSFIDSQDRIANSWARTANTSISTNWDITHACWLAKQACPVNVRLRWIKAHQDDDTPYAQLPLSAQLNCDADRIASDYQRCHGHDEGYAPRLLGNPAQLLINGRTIHTRLRSTILRHYGTTAIDEYTRTRFGWDLATFALIDQPIFEHCMTKMQQSRSTLLKHIYNQSPTARITHRYGTTSSSQCPGCTIPIETEEHIILCQSLSRTEWRASFTANLHRFLTADPTMDPTFSSLITHVCTSYLEQAPITSTAYPTLAHRVIQEQSRLGVHQMFQCRFAHSWVLFHKECHGTPDLASSRQFFHKFATFLLDQWLLAWHARNGDCHGPNPTEAAARRRTTMLAELRSIYDSKMQMLPAHRDHLHDSYEAHDRHANTNAKLLNWLTSFRPLFQASIKEAVRKSLQGVASIRNYFHPR